MNYELRMKNGFTLVEMLVVIGIIAVLTAASVVGFSKMQATAEQTKVSELVSNTASALNVLYQQRGRWPKSLRDGASAGRLDHDSAVSLAKYMSLRCNKDDDGNPTELIGQDKLGIVDHWAAAVIKRKGSSASESDAVPQGGTIKDHILYYAIDLDGDGIVEANVGGETVKIRASAAVWSAGKDGEIDGYSGSAARHKVNQDNVYSWNRGQATRVD